MKTAKPRVDESVKDKGWQLVPTNGKIPIVKGWAKEDSPNYDIPEGSNYAITCGKRNGIHALDFDKLKETDSSEFMDGVKVLEMIIDQLNDGNTWATPTAISGGGGLHIYFKYNERFHPQGTNMITVRTEDSLGMPQAKLAKIDARSDGGLITGPGSIHPTTGKRYQWKPEYSLDDFGGELEELPDIFIKLLSRTHSLVIVGDRVVLREEEVIERKRVISSPANVSLDLLARIVKGLDPKRADEYGQWRNILFAIDTLVGDEGLAIAVAFSRQSKKFRDEDDVASVMSASRGVIGIGTLMHFLKQDNFELFKEIIQAQREAKVENHTFRDYRKFAQLVAEKKFELDEFRIYCRATIRKIDRQGGSLWLTKNIRKDDKTGEPYAAWDVSGTPPFQGIHNVKFTKTVMVIKKGEEVEKEVESSFLAELQVMSNLLDFPSFDRIDNIPYLRRGDVNYDDDEVCNIFPGFIFDVDEEFDIDEAQPEFGEVLQHVRKIICNDDPEIAKFLLGWIAHGIQKPWERPDSSIITTSTEGTGKNMFWNMIRDVIGNRLFRSFGNARDMVRKFNKQLEGALIVVGSEIKDSCEKFDIEKYKSMITDDTLTIEPKGVDPYDVRNNTRYVILSNNSCPLNISLGERRMFVYRIDDDKKQSVEYYARMAELMKLPKVIKAFFHYFARMDLTGFNPRKFPETELRKKMKVISMPQPYRFAKAIIEGEFELRSVYVNKTDEKLIASNVLYEEFGRWRLENGETSSTTKQNFKNKLSEIGIQELEKKKKINGSAVRAYMIDNVVWSSKIVSLIKKEIPSPEDQSDEE
jgi:hypothetical protein